VGDSLDALALRVDGADVWVSVPDAAPQHAD
jgi:hypothetical protein